jgi:hypothetical protein
MVSSTWKLNNLFSDYDSNGAWSDLVAPGTTSLIVPSASDTAFFDTSNQTNISFTAATNSIGGWTFNPGASNYIFTVQSFQALHFFGVGIVINGGRLTIENLGVIQLYNNSTMEGSIVSSGTVFFLDGSAAGNANITNSHEVDS